MDTNHRSLIVTCPTEVSHQFMQGMADRMAVSYHKYGAVKDAYPVKVDAIDSLMTRLRNYRRDGNTEWLMDVANFAMIEFMFPAHENAHYEPTDSDASPGRAVTFSDSSVHASNQEIGTEHVLTLTDEDRVEIRAAFRTLKEQRS